ncbi:hypothetical protein ANRL1_01067 [Anaerolineae bacterium]|nr:hypothetical protein ANRL1_01067 [Anaerolineae bacterium]
MKILTPAFRHKPGPETGFHESNCVILKKGFLMAVGGVEPATRGS